MKFTPQQLISIKRDNKSHSQEEINHLVNMVTSHEMTDDQIGAWLMAAYLHPLSMEETGWLTLAMANSGERVDLSSLPQPHIDKHSTGGVGDKTTLVVLPILAACGLKVVKMSGSALGITGGTIDKLSSIPGLRLDLGVSELIAQADNVGIALTGQTPSLAPADKVLYALRDATATVDSIPLIVSSILSKKIAGGSDTVLLDVKCGSGAFMKTITEANELTKWLKEIGSRVGLKVITTISDMSQVLGRSVGNALEIREALDTLKFDHRSRFAKFCVSLAGEALGDESKAEAALTSGAAYEAAKNWLTAQGAPAAMFEDPDQVLPKAGFTQKLFVHETGWVESFDAGKIGQIVVDMGGGRQHKGDTIDLGVGVEIEVEIGEELTENELIAVIHARNQADAECTATALREALIISKTPTAPLDPILSIH